MTWAIADRQIDRVLVVDDEADARSSLQWMLADAELEAVDQAGPLPPLEALLPKMTAEADAAICDHHLRTKNYASFDGAELVALSCTRGFPAVLCTRYVDSDIDTIRPFLDRIPAIRRPDELNEPEELRAALEDCIGEMKGTVREERRTWRTQVAVDRVDALDDDILYVEVPAWPLDQTIRLRRKFLPSEVRPQMHEGFRCHAHVNLGAPTADLLFFVGWELG